MMKVLLRITLISFVLLGCSSGSGDDSAQPQKKNLPAPRLVYPTNNLLCINNVLEFDWEAANDSDVDTITYQIEVATDNQFTAIAFSTSSTLTKHTFTLEKGLAYYWRVKATDGENRSSDYSSTFNLYTEGLGVSNHLPFSPELLKPILNAIETEGVTALEWKGSDTDNDPLTFDVYFGVNNPPTTIVSENQTETVLNVNTISGTNYYWKVVVKDDKGGLSIGQVWTFSVE